MELLDVKVEETCEEIQEEEVVLITEEEILAREYFNLIGKLAMLIQKPSNKELLIKLDAVKEERVEQLHGLLIMLQMGI